MKSMGSGKIMVEFFSAEIELRVCGTYVGERKREGGKKIKRRIDKKGKAEFNLE